MKMKVIGIVIGIGVIVSFFLLAIVIIGPANTSYPNNPNTPDFFEAKSMITAQTGHKYEYGIRVDLDNQIIENKVFVDIAIGIVVWSSNNLIRNCTFINCSDEGIVLFGSNNTIENCLFYYCCDGIELQESCNNLFFNLWFFNNYHAGIDAIIHSNNNNTFYNCMFYGNCYAVYFKQSENNSFIDCCFLENQQDFFSKPE